MNRTCKHCHESYAIGPVGGITRQLLLTYCTEECAVNDGMDPAEARRQFEERVNITNPALPEDYAEQRAARKEIFDRITPELASSALVGIADRITSEDALDQPDELDIIHLRQIADWLEAKQNVKGESK